MQCPYCSGSESKVTDSRSVEDSVRRRRECSGCGQRFTTYERAQTVAILVVRKRDGRREPFQRDKLLTAVVTACAKRPIPLHSMERIVQDVERELQKQGQAEVSTTAVGELVMERLQSLDWVAYVRWASVYRNFQDLESFEQVVQDLKEQDKEPPDTLQLTLLDNGASDPGAAPSGRGRRSTRR